MEHFLYRRKSFTTYNMNTSVGEIVDIPSDEDVRLLSNIAKQEIRMMGELRT